MIKKIVTACFALLLCGTVSNVSASSFSWDGRNVLSLNNVATVSGLTKSSTTKSLYNKITDLGSSNGVLIKLYKGTTALTGDSIWYKGQGFSMSYLDNQTATKGDSVNVKYRNGSYAFIPYSIYGTCNYY